MATKEIQVRQAKASEEERDLVCEFLRIMQEVEQCGSWTAGDPESDPQVGEVIATAQSLGEMLFAFNGKGLVAALNRVFWGYQMLLVNCCDSSASHLAIKPEWAAIEQERDELREQLGKSRRAIIVFDAAIERSELDVLLCSACGRPVVCLPDGMPICRPCGSKAEEEVAGA